MSEKRTMKDVLAASIERQMALEPERTMTPEQLKAMVAERRRNRWKFWKRKR